MLLATSVSVGFSVCMDLYLDHDQNSTSVPKMLFVFSKDMGSELKPVLHSTYIGVEYSVWCMLYYILHFEVRCALFMPVPEPRV